MAINDNTYVKMDVKVVELLKETKVYEIADEQERDFERNKLLNKIWAHLLQYETDVPDKKDKKKRSIILENSVAFIEAIDNAIQTYGKDNGMAFDSWFNMIFKQKLYKDADDINDNINGMRISSVKKDRMRQLKRYLSLNNLLLEEILYNEDKIFTLCQTLGFTRKEFDESVLISDMKMISSGRDEDGAELDIFNTIADPNGAVEQRTLDFEADATKINEFYNLCSEKYKKILMLHFTQRYLQLEKNSEEREMFHQFGFMNYDFIKQCEISGNKLTGIDQAKMLGISPPSLSRSLGGILKHLKQYLEDAVENDIKLY